MREQAFVLDDMLSNGIRPDKRMRRNSPYLTTCTGMKATPYGLADHESFTTLVPNILVDTADGTNVNYGQVEGFWTLGAGWANSSGKLSATTSTGECTGTLLYNVTEGVTYTVVFTVEAGGAGSVRALVGSTAGTTQTASGGPTTFTESIVAGNDGTFKIDAVSSATVVVSSISIKPTAGAEVVHASGGVYPKVFKSERTVLLAYENGVVEMDLTAGTDRVYWAFSAGGSDGVWVQSINASTTSVWTAGGGWAEDNTGAEVAFTGTATSNDVSQATGDMTQAINAGFYLVSFDVDVNAATGTLLGSLRVELGTSDGGIIHTVGADGPGTYHAIIYTSEATAAFAFDATSFTGTVSKIRVRDLLDTGNSGITDQWEIASFDKYWFLFDEAQTMFKLPGFGNVVCYTDSTNVTISCGCNYGDRLLMGGIATSGNDYLDGEEWADVWEEWIKYSPEDFFTHRDMKLEQSTVMWGTPGGGDYYIPFSVEMSLFQWPQSGTYTAAKPEFLDRIRKGEMGFLHMEWDGSLFTLKPIGQHAIAYGSNGISVITQRPEGPGLTSFQLTDIGVPGRGCVAGDKRAHVFLDNEGWLWRIEGDLSMKRLGYQELFSTFASGIATNPVITAYDAEEGDYYIGNGVSTYVLSEGGMSKTNENPTSVVRVADGLYAVNTDSAVSTFDVVTETFDMQARGVKTVQVVEYGFTDISSFKNYMQYKYTGSASFSTSDGLPVNTDGVVTPVISGGDFRVRTTGTKGSDAKLDYAIVRWKQSDKRNIRGVITA